MICVRCRTSRSRVRNTTALACCCLALHRHEAHGRALRRLADRFGIRRIVLLPLDERLHVSRRDQPHLVPELADLAGPVMRSGARLHRDNAARLRGEERTASDARSLLRNTGAPAHPRRAPEKPSWPYPGRSC